MSTISSIFHMALLFWIVIDSFGNAPIFVSLLSHFPPEKQRRIVIREMLFALGIMVIFLFFGTGFFHVLNVNEASVQIAGGIILFIIALNMVFASPKHEKTARLSKDPMLVPLAIPAIAGPAILATITIYGGSEDSKLYVLAAIVIAWFFSLPALLLSPFLKHFLGENGIVALERLFGYLVILIATEMTLSGLLTVIDLSA